MSTNPPSNDPKDYNPKASAPGPPTAGTSDNADNVRFTDSEVRFAANDGRPAVIANNSTGVRFDRFTAQRGSNSPSGPALPDGQRLLRRRQRQHERGRAADQPDRLQPEL